MPVHEIKQSDTTNLEITDDLTTVKFIIDEMVKALNAGSKKSRERSLLVTKLQEARMWALEAQAVE